jgi:hypothetical protein
MMRLYQFKDARLCDFEDARLWIDTRKVLETKNSGAKNTKMANFMGENPSERAHFPHPRKHKNGPKTA